MKRSPAGQVVPPPAARPRLVPPVQSLGRLLLRGGLRLRVTGLEHIPATGPVLVAGNHSGFLDGPLVFAVLPRPAVFLVKSELYAGRLGQGLHLLGQIPVDRGRADRTALRRARQVLADGQVLGVFPEGTRGTGELTGVQHGVAYLALASGAPVLPVACLGTAQALPRGSHRPRLRSPVEVVFGAPFRVQPDGDPRSRRVVADQAEVIRQRLVAHLQGARRQRAGAA